jgi:peptidoglycan/xylan/chitin deacetylase (PgdA/CDA1 family)
VSLGRRLAKLTGPIERALWPHSPVILIYHRVAPTEGDIWGMTVDEDRFAEQIQALKRMREVVPLERLVAGDQEGLSGKPLAAVTFDDGYHDAYTAARPILERLDCPATVYVSSGLIDGKKEFWWDELARLFMETPQLPAHLTLTFGGAPETLQIPAKAEDRRGVCARVRRRLRALSPSEIDERISELCAWARSERTLRPGYRAMTGEEVGRLSKGLVTVGAHTLAHASLPVLSPRDQLAEMEQSRKACEGWTGGPVRHFAYPFGHYDGATLEAVSACGFSSSCATTPGVVRPWTDRRRLPRLSPGRMDGEALTRMLA